MHGQHFQQKSINHSINRVGLPIYPVRGQLNKENDFFALSPFAPGNGQRLYYVCTSLPTGSRLKLVLLASSSILYVKVPRA